MTKITINVSGAGAETSMEGPGVSTAALELAGRETAAGALNAGSAPSLADATMAVAPVVGSVDDVGAGDSGTGQPIAAGPPPERLFEMFGGDQ
jgi:hypothetical protein